jgi:hypothetical protein
VANEQIGDQPLVVPDEMALAAIREKIDQSQHRLEPYG